MKGLTWSSNFLSQISCMLALSLFQLHYLPWQLLECVVSLSKWGSYGFHPAFLSWATFPGHCLLGCPLQQCWSARALPSARQAELGEAAALPFLQYSKGVQAVPISFPTSLSNNRLMWAHYEPWFSSNPVICSWNDEKAAAQPSFQLLQVWVPWQRVQQSTPSTSVDRNALLGSAVLTSVCKTAGQSLYCCQQSRDECFCCPETGSEAEMWHNIFVRMQCLTIDCWAKCSCSPKNSSNLVFVHALRVCVDRLITGEHRYDGYSSSVSF